MSSPLQRKEKESLKEDKPRVVYVGDLHLGNYYADILSFLQLLHEIKKREKKVDEIVFLGDFLDGLDKYSTQNYKQFPETLNMQREALKWLVELIEMEFQAKIVFILGNHESDFRGSLIDVELFEYRYRNVKFVREYVDENGFYCLHMISPRLRGSAQVFWTPEMLNRAKSILMSKEQGGGRKLSGIITAHVHKGLSLVQQSSKLFILLPSFLRSPYETAENAMYDPSILLINENEIHIYSKSFNELNTVKDFNARLLSLIQEDRKKALDLELLLRNTSSEPGNCDEWSCLRPLKGGLPEVVEVEYCGRKFRVDRELYEKIVRCYDATRSGEKVARELGINRNLTYGVIKDFKSKMNSNSAW